MPIVRITGTVPMGADRKAPDYGLDEVVARRADFHIERMSANGFWFSVRCGEEEHCFWLSSKTKIVASHERREFDSNERAKVTE